MTTLILESVAELHVKIPGRERIDHEMPRTVGQHIAVQACDADHGSGIPEQHEALDGRERTQLDGIDPGTGILAAKSKLAYGTRRRSPVNMAGLQHIVARFHRNLDETVPVGFLPFCRSGTVTQIIFRQHTHARIRRHAPVRTLHMEC